MTPNQARLNLNPILTGMFKAVVQGSYIATQLFPNLPQKLSISHFGETGLEAFRRYNLSRAPGSNTKRINMVMKDKTFTLKQRAVDLPIDRETIEENNYLSYLNVGAYPEISQFAVNTISDVLALDYELDVADMLKAPSTYSSDNVITFTPTQKWSDPGSDPIADIKKGKEIIRQKTGLRANTLTLGPMVESVLLSHPKLVALLSNSNDKIVTIEHLKRFFEVDRILVGDAIWTENEQVMLDVWGNMALLSYSPEITLQTASAMRAPFGLTSVKEGHPFMEQVRYDGDAKSWIYGGTYERMPNLTKPDAGVLFDQPINI